MKRRGEGWLLPIPIAIVSQTFCPVNFVPPPATTDKSTPPHSLPLFQSVPVPPFTCTDECLLSPPSPSSAPSPPSPSPLPRPTDGPFRLPPPRILKDNEREAVIKNTLDGLGRLKGDLYRAAKNTTDSAGRHALWSHCVIDGGGEVGRSQTSAVMPPTFGFLWDSLTPALCSPGFFAFASFLSPSPLRHPKIKAGAPNSPAYCRCLIFGARLLRHFIVFLPWFLPALVGASSATQTDNPLMARRLPGHFH